MKASLVILTCSSQQESERIANQLLKKHLIACVKYLPVNTTSRWNGKVEKNHEVVLVMESLESKFNVIEKIVKSLHSYELPVLLQVPISNSSAGVLNWIRRNTA